MKRTFEALATAVSVDIDDDLPERELAWMLLEAYAPSPHAPALAFHLRGGSEPALVCEGRYTTAVEHVADLVPLFELDLYHALVEHAPPGLVLHAAALERDGAAIVLAGGSGDGKTTATLALIERGWRMSTDEIVHITRDGTVRGLARPIHVQPTRVHAIPSDWLRRAYPMRGRDDPSTVVVQPPAAARVPSPLPLRAIARIGHAASFSPELERLAPARGLSRVWECTLRGDDDGLAVATALAAAYPAFEVRSASVDQAAKLVELLAKFCDSKLGELPGIGYKSTLAE